jgi:hypothetical protein
MARSRLTALRAGTHVRIAERIMGTAHAGSTVRMTTFGISHSLGPTLSPRTAVRLGTKSAAHFRPPVAQRPEPYRRSTGSVKQKWAPVCGWENAGEKCTETPPAELAGALSKS